MGFGLVFRDQPKWQRLTGADTQDVYVKRDTDRDGRWDGVERPTERAWIDRHPSGSWNAGYIEP